MLPNDPIRQSTTLLRRIIIKPLVSLFLVWTLIITSPGNDIGVVSVTAAAAATDVFHNSEEPLLLTEISKMRARDLKRRLIRHHGYASEEVNKMLEKSDLINALAYEEHRNYERRKANKKREIMYRSVMVAIAAVGAVMFWPLIREATKHMWAVGSVNFVVYTDKKRYEIDRCWQLGSLLGVLGLLVIVFVEALQLWLSTSILLSWVMKSKYFFPTPNIPIRPAAMLSSMSGAPSDGGPLGQYGINIGPMIIGWVFRWLRGKLDIWMGGVLSRAYIRRKAERKEAKKQNMTEEEKAERKMAKAERKAERAAAREREVEEELQRYKWRAAQIAKMKEEELQRKEMNAQKTESSPQTSSSSHIPTDKKHAMAAAAELRRDHQSDNVDDNDKNSYTELNSETAFDDLD